MTYRHEGFLFIHADSRGGSTFVEADDRRDALERYATAFGYDREQKRLDWNDEGDIDAEEWLKALEQEDFVAPAIIYSETPIANGQDLDGGMNGDAKFDDDCNYLSGKTAWVLGEGHDDEFINFQPGEVVRIHYGERPSEPHYLPRWDDDAFGLLFIPAGHDCLG